MQANSSDLVPETTLEEKMAGKGRKAAQQVEGEEFDRSESGVEMKLLMKMFLESNERAEARRREDKLAEEERMEARRVEGRGEG